MDISLEQRIAVNLRLSQRLMVEVGSGQSKNVGSVGLAHHMKTGHGPCSKRRETVRIDFHQEIGRDERDWFVGCPADLYDGRLHRMIYRVIEIESFGGLGAWTRTPIAHLPARLVWFVKTCIETRDRLLAERDALRVRLSK